MPPVEIARLTGTATSLPRPAGSVRPSHAVAGAFTVLGAVTGVVVAGLTPFTSLAAAVALLLFRGLADYRGAARIVPVGVAVLALGVVALLTVPVVRVLAEIITGIGAGILLPAAIALIVAPDLRADSATPTPRITLPRSLAIPVSSRARYRLALTLSAASGALVAVAAVVTQDGAPGSMLIVAGAASVVLTVAALRLVFSVSSPAERAEATGATLLPSAAVVGLGWAAAGIANAVSDGAGVVAASVVGVAGVLVMLAGFRRVKPETLTGSGRGYKSAVASFDATVPLVPERALTARSAAEVQSAVRAARALDLGVRAHSTGHAAGTVNPVRDSALVKVLINEPVTVDVDRRTVRIPAGTAWRDVVLAITPHGLGAPHGSSSHVGAIGYLLRGGLSAYGRTTGLAANSIESIEVVLADGDLVVADRDRHPDLFWALRGGGGGLGVVTAITVRLFDLAKVVTGTAIWSVERAPELAAYWDAWRHTAPREITTTLRVLNFPPFPGLPRAIVGQPIIVIDGSVVAATERDVDAAEAVALDLLDGLRDIATPLLDSWKTATPLETANTHMDPPIGPPHTSDHLLLQSSGPEAVDTFVTAALSDDATVSSMELRQLGGTLADPSPDGGAVSHYRGDLAFWGLGIHSKKLPHDEINHRLDGLREQLSPWDSGYSVPTFAPDPSRPQRTLDASAASRVADIREQYDPEGVFAGDVAAGAAVR